MDKNIIIDGVNVAECERRIGKNNFCRYFKRNCADNNYNCIWKKCLRLEQENKQMKSALEEIRKYLNTLSSVDSDFPNTETYLRIQGKISEVLND